MGSVREMRGLRALVCVAALGAVAFGLSVDSAASTAGTGGVAVGGDEVAAEVLSLELSVFGPSYVLAGGTITYEMTVTNPTSSRFSNIGLFAAVPDDTTFVSGGDFVPADGGSEFRLGGVAPGASKQVSLVVRSDAGLPVGSFIENDFFEIYSSTVNGRPGPEVFADFGVRTTVEEPGSVVAVYRNDAGRAFDVTVDSYGFENYSNSPPRVSSDDLSARDLFEFFGPDVCRSGDTAATCVLSGPARKWMEAQIDSMNGGHCDGLAATSLRLFDELDYRGRSVASDFQPGAATTADLAFPEASIENYIAHYWTTQLMDEVWFDIVEGSPVELLNHLIAEFDKPDPVPYTVAIFTMPGYGKGHSIAAYGVERVNDRESRILVYDNNFPRQRQYITINTVANTWRYVTAATPGEPVDVYEGTATGPRSGGMWLVPTRSRDLPDGEYFYCPFCALGGGAGLTAGSLTAGVTPPGHRAGRFNIHYNGEGAFLVLDDEGNGVGSDPTTSMFRNEIPGSRVMPFNGGRGRQIPPTVVIRYVEPDEARYTVVVHGLTTDNVTSGSLTIVGDGFAIGVNDIDLDPGELFEFTFSPDGDHISFTSTEATEAPEIFISHDPVRSGDPSVIFDIEGVTLLAGETVSLDLDPELEQIHFADTGAQAENFDIDMKLIWPDGDVGDWDEMIHLPAGATSAFVDFGAWDHVLDPPVYIDGVLQNPSVNHRLRLDDVETSFDPTPQPDAPSGVFRTEATFTNVTEVALEDVSFSIADLGDGDVVLNADGAPAGAGGRISVPDAALGPDGILRTNESFTLSLEVGLAEPGRSRVVLDGNGVPHDWIHPDPPPSYDAQNASFEFDVGTGPFCRGRLATIVGEGYETLVGTDGDDVIFGSNLGQIIFGRGGDDIICANGGRDVVYGQVGDDWVDGGRGNDRLFGAAGNDTLIGGGGNDELYGGGNRDLLIALGGSDIVRGGAGNDQAVARDGRPDDIDLQGGTRDRAQFDGNGIDTVTGVEITD